MTCFVKEWLQLKVVRVYKEEGALSLTHSIVTKHNARFMYETGYAFKLNKINNQQMRSSHWNHNTSV